MPFAQRRTDLPVLLVHNIDPRWGAKDREESRVAADALEAALRQEGHPVTPVTVAKADLESLLQPYDPDEFVVFNWCEELPGMPRSESLVPDIYERLGFTYTGANSAALAL
ncbi:MAG: hypothetical protein H6Q02_1992, partial [Acidobacteria bacterium]|nr:hypothetical protein [Acidobacteriota bacterium]